MSGIQVVVQSVALRQDFRLRIDGFGPGETKVFGPVDLPLSHEYLAALNEAVSADLTVVVSSDASDDEYSATYILELLAYDQWPGVRSLPELLAAFSTTTTISCTGYVCTSTDSMAVPTVAAALKAGIMALTVTIRTHPLIKRRNALWSPCRAT